MPQVLWTPFGGAMSYPLDPRFLTVGRCLAAIQARRGIFQRHHYFGISRYNADSCRRGCRLKSHLKSHPTTPQHRTVTSLSLSEPSSPRTCKQWRRSWAKKSDSSTLTEGRSGPPLRPHPARGYLCGRKVDKMGMGVDPSWFCWGISTTERQLSSMRF